MVAPNGPISAQNHIQRHKKQPSNRMLRIPACTWISRTLKGIQVRAHAATSHQPLCSPQALTLPFPHPVSMMPPPVSLSFFSLPPSSLSCTSAQPLASPSFSLLLSPIPILLTLHDSRSGNQVGKWWMEGPGRGCNALDTGTLINTVSNMYTRDRAY